MRSVEDAGDTSAHVERSPPKASPSEIDEHVQKNQETEPKVHEEMSCDQIIEELDVVAANQSALVAQLKAKYVVDYSQIA